MKGKQIEQRVDVEYNSEIKIWNFLVEEKRKISIIPWKTTKKGAITEFHFKDNKKEFIIEFLEKNFNEEFYSQRYLSGTAAIIMEICQRIADTAEETEEEIFPYELEACIKTIMTYYPNQVKGAHIYYGMGEFFGIKKEFTFLKKIEEIPSRSMRYPGTRLDSID